MRIQSNALVKANLLVTGDELLRGFVQEANSIIIARDLRNSNIDLEAISVVGDNEQQLKSRLKDALNKDIELIITTGGLGPTHDDRTTQLVSEVTGRELTFDQLALDTIEERLKNFGRLKNSSDYDLFRAGNQKQATFPLGAFWVQPSGTAPGYILKLEEWGKTIIVLPGPPSEMRFAWQQILASEHMRELLHNKIAHHERLLRAWGVPESRAAMALKEIGHEDSPTCTVTLCARDNELEIAIRGSDVALIDNKTAELCELLKDFVFAIDDERPVAQIVGDMLVERSMLIATAESCSAGLISASLTDAPGSSSWFVGGVASYANEAKVKLLNVSEKMLSDNGAVSYETAESMAIGAVLALNADIAVSVTGIAGPGGGSDEKPVGTVYFAVRSKKQDISADSHIRISGDRNAVRRRATVHALHLVRLALAKK